MSATSKDPEHPISQFDELTNIQLHMQRNTHTYSRGAVILRKEAETTTAEKLECIKKFHSNAREGESPKKLY